MTINNFKRMAAVCASFSMFACFISATPSDAAETVSARSLPEKVAPRSTSIVSNTVATVNIPESVFIDRPPPQGKDPFFPDAHYRKLSKNDPIATPGQNGDALLATLKLTGFGGVGNKRWAMINGVAIYEGESSPVRIGGNLHQVACLEMKDQSVLVGIKDNPARRELKLDN